MMLYEASKVLVSVTVWVSGRASLLFDKKNIDFYYMEV